VEHKTRSLMKRGSSSGNKTPQKGRRKRRERRRVRTRGVWSEKEKRRREFKKFVQTNKKRKNENGASYVQKDVAFIACFSFFISIFFAHFQSTVHSLFLLLLSPLPLYLPPLTIYMCKADRHSPQLSACLSLSFSPPSGSLSFSPSPFAVPFSSSFLFTPPSPPPPPVPPPLPPSLPPPPPPPPP